MVKLLGSPTAAWCSRSSSRQKRWKVPTKSASARPLPTMPATRSFISRAALLVKVTARTFSGGTPSAISWAIRQVITRVLPEPAPASTRSGPRVCITASFCSGLSPLV